MSDHPYVVSGLYESRESAQRACQSLRRALPDEARCHLLHPDDDAETVDKTLQLQTLAVRDSLVEDTLKGSAIGSALGVAGSGGLAAAGIPLVIASPVAATLWGLGYGAMLGTIAGGAKSFRLKESDHHSLVKEALHNDSRAVVAHLRDEAEVKIAHDCLSHSAEHVADSR